MRLLLRRMIEHPQLSISLAAQNEIIYKSVIVQVMRHLKDRTGGYPIVAQLQATRRQKQVIEELANQGLWDWDGASSQITVTNQRAADDNRRPIQAQCAKHRLNGVFFGVELRTLGAAIADRM